MTLPDKLATQEYMSIRNGVMVLFNEQTGKKRKFKLPKYLVDEIEFQVEMAKNDGMNTQLSIIRNALDGRVYTNMTVSRKSSSTDCKI